MTEAAKRVPGVQDAQFNFLTQKLTLVADDEGFDAIVDEVARVCRKVEPDCEILR